MALKIANISESTPNPTGGIIERDSKGNLTGILYNLQATDLILKHIPYHTAEMVQENILSHQSLLAANGVTSFQDNYLRPPETINLYLDLGRKGKMVLRVRPTMRWSIRTNWMVPLRSNAMRTSSSALPASSGEAKTIGFLEQKFQKLGLKPGNGQSFFQEIPMVVITADPGARLDIKGGKKPISFGYKDDFVAFTERVSEEVSLIDSDIVFAGYGIIAPEYNWNDYAGLDVHGKTVLVLINDPGYATQDPALFSGRR
jgi:hypothetical protein